MTDNIIPFDKLLAETHESTSDHSADDSPEHDHMMGKLIQVRHRYDAIVTLIESVNLMITGWMDQTAEYTDDDVAVVERMINSMEDALYISVDENPEDHRDT